MRHHMRCKVTWRDVTHVEQRRRTWPLKMLFFQQRKRRLEEGQRLLLEEWKNRFDEIICFAAVMCVSCVMNTRFTSFAIYCFLRTGGILLWRYEFKGRLSQSKNWPKWKWMWVNISSFWTLTDMHLPLGFGGAVSCVTTSSYRTLSALAYSACILVQSFQDF